MQHNKWIKCGDDGTLMDNVTECDEIQQHDESWSCISASLRSSLSVTSETTLAKSQLHVGTCVQSSSATSRRSCLQGKREVSAWRKRLLTPGLLGLYIPSHFTRLRTWGVCLEQVGLPVGDITTFRNLSWWGDDKNIVCIRKKAGFNQRLPIFKHIELDLQVADGRFGNLKSVLREISFTSAATLLSNYG